ncbi:MAG: methyltransferase domain-containing protein [Candidatus Micrarchaeota archaeon]
MNRQKLPFKDSRFDVITMIDCVEHFENPEKVISEAKRVLKPGGFIFIETANYNAIGRKIFGKDWPVYSDNYHLYPWVTRKKLERWLSPLTVIDYWTFGFQPPLHKSELGKAFLRGKVFLFLSGILFWRRSPAYYFFRKTHADYWDCCWCAAKKARPSRRAHHTR